MEKKETPGSAGPQSGSIRKRLFHWMDRRAGVDKLMHESLDEPIPGGARFAYVFGSGLLFIFISQIITGICLAVYYVPSAETAHTSVAYITKQVAAGAFLRSLHYYGSSAMIIVLLLHFLQTFLYGSFKGRRELLWISGATLSLLVLAMGFTGYLLPWDQKAYFATAVGTNIVGEVPFIGEWLTLLMRGGDTIGTLTLSRFYVAHVFLIPGCIFAFIAVHIFLFRKAGAAGPIHEDPVEPKLAPESFYPRQVLMDMGFALLLMVGLGFLAYFRPMGLGPIANPADTHFLPRPEWYYLPFFEWLKFWEGPEVVLAIVVIPGIIAALFFLLPFLDRNLERRPWRRPIPVLAVAIVLSGTIFLGFKSRMDDRDDPSTAAQLAMQEKQEAAYTAAPFEPYIESPGGTGPLALPTGPVDPLVSHGRGVFQAHGCSGCHGDVGLGSTVAPSLKGVTQKYPAPQLEALLHNPNAAMRAGHMPAVDASPSDMAALLAYLKVIGTPAANVQASSGASPQMAAAALPAPENGNVPGSAAPAQAMPTQLSNLAAAGQQLYQQHACFACHGPGGSGGRAPAIAPLIAQQSNVELDKLLASPSAKMRAGGMPSVENPQERRAIIAYLRTMHAPMQGGAQPVQAGQATQPEIASNGGSVPYPDMAPAPATPAAAAKPIAGASTSTRPGAPTLSGAFASSPGRALFLSQGCAACHGLSAQGTQFAPSLIGVGKKFPGNKLPDLLHHPTAKMKAGGMPTVTLTGTPLQQLVSYLSSLQTASTPVQTASSNGAVTAQRARAASGNAGQAAPNSQTTPVPAPPLSPLAKRGQQIFESMPCASCHGVGGLHGTAAAPPLAGTASLLPENVLENLLRHHTTRMQEGGMPLTNLNAPDMKALVAFIRSMPATPNGD
ncbi:MAG TPA: c-type cytochrome [Terracidiphilus sp.]|nr:c-type cytochrome [Terracidiphilus sp.]